MVFFFIIYIAIGIVIMNAMLMAVFERIREFGVLKALGMGPGQVLILILLESSIITGLAVVIGAALATPTLFYLQNTGLDLGSLSGMSVMGSSFDSTWHATINANTFATPILVLVIIVGIAVLYPALKAAMIRPVDAMTHR